MRRRIAPIVLALTLFAVGAGCSDGNLLTSTSTTEGAGAAGQPPAGDGDVEGRIERAVFDLVNEERRARGLDPVEWDDQLMMFAREWSSHMAERGRLEHQDGERMLERADGFTVVGENVFTATAPVPASTIHVGWMRSDGHRVNVLRLTFDRLGIGVVCTADGEVWATQRFGSTSRPSSRPANDEIPPEEPIVASQGEGPRCPGEPGEVRIDVDG